MESNFHAFSYIEHGKEVEERIGYINHSDHTIRLSIHNIESTGALKVTYPTTIAPNGKGDIVLSYALDEASTKYGTLSDIFQFEVDGVCNKTLISTYAIAVDNFDLVEDILAPSAVVSKKIIKFGDVKHGSKVVDASLTLANNGERDLIIRAVEWQSKALEL